MKQDIGPQPAAIVTQMRTVDPDVEYLAATLLGSADGWSLSFQSSFVGWPEDHGPEDGIELREASRVHPEKMLDLWSKAGQGWMVVSNEIHLGLFFRVGGNALIETALASEYLQDHVRARPVVRTGALGFETHVPGARAATNRRPTPVQRTRVMERDGHRCQLCGERPSLNEHVVLHLHHIRPFGGGGLTADENLITLCHTCHLGLEPHDKPALFWLPGGQAWRELDLQDPDIHQQRQADYQRLVEVLENSPSS
jgi:5-methylcytosine-specific restriction endonuclease McrA